MYLNRYNFLTQSHREKATPHIYAVPYYQYSVKKIHIGTGLAVQIAVYFSDLHQGASTSWGDAQQL